MLIILEIYVAEQLARFLLAFSLVG